MYRILVVEDDAVIETSLIEQFKKWGFLTKGIHDFSNIIKEWTEYKPHLVVLDISLPYYNGYYWCSEIRKVSKVPILFLSSNSENMDIIMAIQMGGDDFVTKPFSMELLITKVQALLRRAYDYQEETEFLECRGGILNLSEGNLYYKDTTIDLTKNEFRILSILLEKKNTIVSRDSIMRKLWNEEEFIDDNTLTVNINRLRKKLEQYGLEQFIETKKGMGYIIHD